MKLLIYYERINHIKVKVNEFIFNNSSDLKGIQDYEKSLCTFNLKEDSELSIF